MKWFVVYICLFLDTDPLIVDIICLLENKTNPIGIGHQWFVFGLKLGLTVGDLHNITMKYSGSLECGREVILLWRSRNMSASWEPITTALDTIGRKDIAGCIKNYFTAPPELQAQGYLTPQSITSKLTMINLNTKQLYNVNESKLIRPLYDIIFLKIEKPDPSELFQGYFEDLCKAIGSEVNFDRIMNKLFTHQLITQDIYNDITTTLCYSVYQKGSKVVTELHRQIQSSNESEQILLKICDVLISTENESLKETAGKMKSLLLKGTISNINYK